MILEHIQADKLHDVVRETTGVVIVDFWATWCNPCRALSTVLKQVDERFEGRINIIKMKCDDEAANTLALNMNIRTIPTLMFYKDGKYERTLTGFHNAKTIVELIETIQRYQQPQER